MEYYPLIKSLHIIFVVTWFAGLFYIVRLFIYHKEVEERPIEEQKILIPQYQLMEKRLWYIISWPSLVLTWGFGLTLLIMRDLWSEPWMHLKLSFVFGLTIYHLFCHRILCKLKHGDLKLNSTQLRLWNELATLFLIVIVFLVVYQRNNGWYKGVLGFAGVAVLLFTAVFIYKKYRNKK